MISVFVAELVETGTLIVGLTVTDTLIAGGIGSDSLKGFADGFDAVLPLDLLTDCIGFTDEGGCTGGEEDISVMEICMGVGDGACGGTVTKDGACVFNLEGCIVVCLNSDLLIDVALDLGA